MSADPFDPDDAYSVESGFRGLLAAIVAKLTAKFGGRLSAEEILSAARRAIESIQAPAPATWEAANPVTIQQASRVAQLHRACRIVATITELRAPQIVRTITSGVGRDVEAVSVCVADGSGDSIWSLDVLGASLADRLHELHQVGVPAEFLALPISLPVDLRGKKPAYEVDWMRRNIFLHVLDARPSSSALDLLGATASERAQAVESIDGLVAAGDDPHDWLLQEVIDVLHVEGLDDFPLLRSLLAFTVLQATSCDRVYNASGRLHAIVAGPPGQGKKLLGLAARVLNPVCCEISPAKVSPAGLVGASHCGAEGWTSRPGLLPRASGGVAVLQDAHGWRPSVVRDVAPILQELMEDGVVRDSVAAGRRRVANTALLVDLNRFAHVTRAASTGKEAAILQVRPVLSRADLLAELPPDARRSFDVGRRMCAAVARSSPSIEDDPRVRALRLVVAALRDRVDRIDLGPVQDLLLQAYDQIADRNREVIAKEPEAGDMPTRLVISLARYTSASARASARVAASAEDVNRAIEFLNLKLRFLEMLGPSAVDVPDAASWVARHAGETVRTQDVVEEYERETGSTVSERTVRRALNDIGARRRGRGVYLLPPFDDAST